MLPTGNWPDSVDLLRTCSLPPSSCFLPSDPHAHPPLHHLFHSRCPINQWRHCSLRLGLLSSWGGVVVVLLSPWWPCLRSCLGRVDVSVDVVAVFIIVSGLVAFWIGRIRGWSHSGVCGWTTSSFKLRTSCDHMLNVETCWNPHRFLSFFHSTTIAPSPSLSLSCPFHLGNCKYILLFCPWCSLS